MRQDWWCRTFRNKARRWSRVGAKESAPGDRRDDHTNDHNDDHTNDRPDDANLKAASLMPPGGIDEGFGWRRMLPALSIVLMMLISIIIVPNPKYSQVVPSFALAALFCWIVWQPGLLPVLLIFLLGLFEDLVRGTPLGMTAFIYLLTYALTRLQKDWLTNRGLDMFWIGFAGVVLTTAFVQWLILSLAAWIFIASGAALLHSLLTIVTFPAVFWLLAPLQRTMPQVS